MHSEDVPFYVVTLCRLCYYVGCSGGFIFYVLSVSTGLSSLSLVRYISSAEVETPLGNHPIVFMGEGGAEKRNSPSLARIKRKTVLILPIGSLCVLPFVKPWV